METKTEAETERFARLIDNARYGAELTFEQEKEARDLGLVVVFGASDDLMELRGALDDELDCYDGGTFYLDKNGPLPNRDEIEEDGALEAYFERKKAAHKIEAVWGEGEWSWSYRTDIPHATFTVFEDREKYCQGIVFALNNL
ncbi:hypothetical protein [Larkinella soli]|uniref:hypothetical protein n=1 Tax=Larkinella soli TaxID=1770527 RepID=UPI0019D10F0F|nr:hypothetical protein [Larkinella soli]